jgi:two-component system nitrate/nitrite response regulator NarL
MENPTVAEPDARPIHLLIIDDHTMFREGLARMFERAPDLKVVGHFASSSAGLSALAGPPVDVVLLDVDLGAERAMDFVTGARQQGFEGRILIVTAGVSDQEAVRLVQAGVAGIVHKQHSTEVLCDKIRQIAGGEVCLEPAYLAPLFRSVGRAQTPGRTGLTERDKVVLRLILQGLSNREIGEHIEISEGAVKSALRQLFGKLNVRTRSQLVKTALEQYRDQL